MASQVPSKPNKTPLDESKSVKTWRTGPLCLQVLTGLQGHAEFMRSGWFCVADWCWDWISGGAVLLSVHTSIPFPCYYFFPALSLIILFFFLSLVSSLLSFFYFLHVWLFLSVPLFLFLLFFLLPFLLCFSSVGPSFPGGFFITYLWLCMSFPCPHPQLPRHPLRTDSWPRVLVEYSTRGWECLWIIIPDFYLM